MPMAIHPLKKNITEKMSGAQNTAISSILMPVVPVLYNKRPAAVVLLP
jgi:hypothetical protein